MSLPPFCGEFSPCGESRGDEVITTNLTCTAAPTSCCVQTHATVATSSSAPPRIKKRALRLAYAWLTEKSCKERSDGIASLRASLFSATKRSYEPAAVSGGAFLFATYANKNAPPLTSGKAKWWRTRNVNRIYNSIINYCDFPIRAKSK